MALKHTTEIFLQNENRQTDKYTGVHISNIKTYKGNSCGMKYGLSELSNDKTYLETELPARKRFKNETKLYNTTKCLNKISKAIGNDDESTNSADEEKHSAEISNVSSEQGLQNNSSLKELLKSDLIAEINQKTESSVVKFSSCNSIFQSTMTNQFKLDSDKVSECNFEKKLENHEFETNSENVISKKLNYDKILNQGTEGETGFDDEVNKCCRLLNLDVPKMAALISDSKIASDNFRKKSFENSEIYKCKNQNYYNQNLNILYPKSDKFKSMPNDENINLGLINLDKKLNEKNCDNDVKFKDKGNLISSTMVISNSSLTTNNTNCINLNDRFFYDKIKTTTEDNNLLESELKQDDKYNSKINLKNILNLKKSSIKVPNILKSKVQNHDIQSNTKHLNLTVQDTLNSDSLKFQETNQIVNLNVDNDEVSFAIDDSGDILILHNESDIDFDETKEISETNASKSAYTILAETSIEDETVFLAGLEDNKNNKYTTNEVTEKYDFISNEKCNTFKKNNSPDDNTNCESSILDSINDCIKNKNDFDVEANESFVSEYEISLLAKDNDSIFSEESLDSEYEISLLEDGISDEENQNDLQENKSDSNVSSLLNDENKEKIAINPQEFTKEIKIEAESEQIIDKAVSSKKNVSENIASPEERIPSNIQTATKIDLHVEKSVQKELPISSKIKSNENTDNTEQNFITITDDVVTLKPEQPSSLKFENPSMLNILIKKDLQENSNNSHYQIKSEIYNESHTSNKELLDNKEFKNSEEKAPTVILNKNHVYTDKPLTEKFINIELDALNTGKSKQNINEEFQPSNEVKKNEIRKNKEKESVIIKKQITESSDINKISEKAVKTDLKASTSHESKQDEQNIIPDYYEEEKEDLINPGWNKIKELSTDEERYRQVRDCWKSKNIPNPFKNLTYYSYRKRKITSGENNTCQTKQHKRHASSNLNDKDAKRSRSCTYIFDDRIKSIEKEKEIKAKTLQDKMFNEVCRLNELQYQREKGLQNFYGFNFDPRRQFQLINLRSDYQQRVSSLTAEYEQTVNDCCDQYTTEINSLKNSRNEVLQFYSFYKGLNINEHKDPTVLTNAQIQELEEIENIYNQMDLQYR